MAHHNLLKPVYLFKNLRDDELDKVNDVVKVKRYSRGQPIFEEGSLATALYLVKMGSVAIKQAQNGEDIQVALLGSGSHFGEMAFIDSEPRSATAECVEDTDILEISYDNLNTLMARDSHLATKFYCALAHFLAGRLRTTTHDLSFSRELNLRHF